VDERYCPLTKWAECYRPSVGCWRPLTAVNMKLSPRCYAVTVNAGYSAGLDESMASEIKMRATDSQLRLLNIRLHI